MVSTPPSQPRRVKTVAVARTASDVSTVSQPTVRIQDRIDGTALPLTPNAARLSTMVGADPRLPAIATKPQSTKEMTIPTTPTMTAWAKETLKASRKLP